MIKNKNMLRIGDKVIVKPRKFIERYFSRVFENKKLYCCVINYNLDKTFGFYTFLNNNPQLFSIGFNEDMFSFCSKEVTIKDMWKDPKENNFLYYKIEEDNGEFDWAEEVFCIKCYSNLINCIRNFCKNYCLSGLCINCSLSKYKKELLYKETFSIGDRVFIKPYNWIVQHLDLPPHYELGVEYIMSEKFKSKNKSKLTVYKLPTKEVFEKYGRFVTINNIINIDNDISEKIYKIGEYDLCDWFFEDDCISVLKDVHSFCSNCKMDCELCPLLGYKYTRYLINNY